MCVNVNFTHNFFLFSSSSRRRSLCTRKKKYFLVCCREREKFITEWVWAKHRTAFWLVSIFYFHFSGYSSKSKSSSSIFSSSLIIFLLSFCVLIHEEIRGARRGLKKKYIKYLRDDFWGERERRKKYHKIIIFFLSLQYNLSFSIIRQTHNTTRP
jgi:hypothetical protein